MDLRRDALSRGPYQLRFDLKGGQSGGGEVFFTDDPKTILPKGGRVPFQVAADGEWQEVNVELKTDQVIQQLRLDVSEGAGSAEIRRLRLLDDAGNVLFRWPR
jgi:hypothetical protein